MNAYPKDKMGHVFDIVLGTATSVIAIVASLVIWLILFDSSGIEPGGATGHVASRLWPVFFILVTASPLAWWFHRTMTRRLVIFACTALCTLGSMGFYWFVLGCP